MDNKSKILFFAGLICISAFFSSCGERGETKTLKMSIILGENSDWYKAAAKFKELVESKTGGEYKIRIYTHSQLAGQSQRTELEMLQTGVIDITLESSILLSLIEPSMAIPSLPWLFKDYNQAFSLLDGNAGEALLERLKGKRIVGLAYGANGFRQLTNARREIISAESLKSLKVRTPAISLYISIFKMLGADPSPMNFGELFTALAQGTMDGQENPVSVIYSARLYEVQKYLTMWNYSYDPIILCVNGKRWDSFPENIKIIFEESAKEAMIYERNIVAGEEPALIDSLINKGMDVSYPDSSAIFSFRKMSASVYEKFNRGEYKILLNNFKEKETEEN